ncbi:hypothetical protein K0M31_019423 [Melipona bicolor]|uniref:Uncharacterized protein n=1 Tax=Melipona bicolor TaxID=60889 RepID=A0AA40G2E8_9HYME|nr:hypothetical protein K0M31_019423 [Melipona bicolor]
METGRFGTGLAGARRDETRRDDSQIETRIRRREEKRREEKRREEKRGEEATRRINQQPSALAGDGKLICNLYLRRETIPVSLCPRYAAVLVALDWHLISKNYVVYTALVLFPREDAAAPPLLSKEKQFVD